MLNNSVIKSPPVGNITNRNMTFRWGTVLLRVLYGLAAMQESST